MLSDGGLVSNCTMDCCQGELCNTGGFTSKPSTAGEGLTKKGTSPLQSTTSKPSVATWKEMTRTHPNQPLDTLIFLIILNSK